MPGSDKQSAVLALDSYLVGLITDGLKTKNQTAEQETLVPTLPTMQLRLDAASSGATKKALDYFFTYAVVLSKTCEHTITCKIGEDTL